MAEVLDRQTLKALSTDTRQDIVKYLQKRPYTASELSKLLQKHVTTITEHLTVLETSGLVQKKDSTNKWVYYTLTDKGDKIFKPKFYSWILMLSVSVLAIAGGLYQTFFRATAHPFSSPTSRIQEAQDAGRIAIDITSTAAQTSQAEFLLGVGLLLLGILGITYVLFKRHRSNLNIQGTLNT